MKECNKARHRTVTKQRGLTLIELMVVLAIIGILATLGITQYQDYVARVRVSEGLQLVEPWKLAAAEQAMENGGSFDKDKLGLPEFVATQNVRDISISSMKNGVGGIITIAYAANVAGGGTLVLNPLLTSSGLQWQCAAAGVSKSAVPPGAIDNTAFTAGTLEARFAPASCR